jgi:hypothetical protein
MFMKLLINVFFGSAFICLLQGCAQQDGNSAASETGQAGILDPTTASIAFMNDYRNTPAAVTGDIPLMVELRVGSATDPDVCTSGESYGPFTVTGSSIDGVTTIEATQSTLRLANLGNLTICMIVTSPVDSILDVNAEKVFMTRKDCDKSAQDIGGTWTGEFSCKSDCGDIGGTVSLDITQDGYTATYTDGYAYYEGTVCGNTFTFVGASESATEGGVFTLNPDGGASKSSEYKDIYDSCTGTCSDTLMRL